MKLCLQCCLPSSVKVQLLINNHLKARYAHGDRDALRRILLLLMQYAVTSTQLGKITLEVDPG